MTLYHLIGVVVTCATALLIGYWYRKQMRQLELFRLDPNVGVIPPPSPPVAFFKRYRGLIVGVGMPMLSLAWVIAMNSPATNGSAALISLNVACILVALHLHSGVRLMNLMDMHLNATANVLRIVEEQGKFLEVLGCQTEAMAARLVELEKQAKEDSS